MNKKQVLIVGAGPTGLLMAHLLARAKISFKIIEKKETTTTLSKALAVHARTLEIFKDIDLVEEMLKKGLVIEGMDFTEGKNRLVYIDFKDLPSEFNKILILPQSETENILLEDLKKKGIEVHWQNELVDLIEKKDHVEAGIKNFLGEISKEEFSYVIGCDGMHSVVREKAQIPFVGKDMEDALSFADLKIHGQIDRKNGILALGKNKDGIIIFLPLPSGKTRLIVNNCKIKKKEEATNEYFTNILQERYDNNMTTSDMDWSSVFYVHYREAALFYRDRICLVGDASHVHSPMAGQGMNTGLQDAYNLAWKLALVCKKKASQKLLKTYHEERHANGKKLLRITFLLTTITASKNVFLKFIRPYWIRFVMGRKRVQQELKMRLSQLEANYCHMSLSKGKFDKGPKSGERAFDCKLNGKRIFDLFGKNLFTLVLFLPKEKELSSSIRKALLKYLEIQNTYSNELKVLIVTKDKKEVEDFGFEEVIQDANGLFYKTYGIEEEGQYLIRPDQYVGLKDKDLNPKKVKAYLKSIFDLI